MTSSKRFQISFGNRILLPDETAFGAGELTALSAGLISLAKCATTDFTNLAKTDVPAFSRAAVATEVIQGYIFVELLFVILLKLFEQLQIIGLSGLVSIADLAVDAAGGN